MHAKVASVFEIAPSGVCIPSPKNISTDSTQAPHTILILIKSALLLLSMGFGLTLLTLLWHFDTAPTPAIWLLAPAMMGVLLRLSHKWWVGAIICTGLGALGATAFFPLSHQLAMQWLIGISLPLAAFGALVVDEIFTHSDRRLTIINATFAILFAAFMPAFLGASIATLILDNTTFATFVSWFSAIALGTITLLPLALIYQKGFRSHFTLESHGLLTTLMLLIATSFAWWACTSLNSPYFFSMLPLIASALVLRMAPAFVVTAITIAVMATLSPLHDFIAFDNSHTMRHAVHGLPLLFMGFFATVLSILINAMHSERQRLSQSESRFRDAMKYSPIGMGLTTLNGQFTLVNESLCKMTGFTGRDMAHQKLSSLIAPAQREDLAVCFDKMIAGQDSIVRKNIQLIDKKGQIVFTRLAASVLKDATGQCAGLVIQIEDFNQMEQARQALKESEDLLEFAIDGSGIGVWDINCTANQSYCSPRTRGMMGLGDLDEINSIEQWLSHVHPDDRDDTRHLVNDHIANNTKFFSKEHRVMPHDGEHIWVLTRGKVVEKDVQGQPLRLVGTMLDVTQHKQAELSMAQMHERMLLATQAAHIGVWEWAREGAQVAWDDRMFEILGLNRASTNLQGVTWLDFVHEEDSAKTRAILTAALTSTDNSFEIEARFVHASGQIRYARNLGTIMRDADGIAHRMVGAFWDVTERAVLQNNLHDERNRLAVSLNSIADAIITTDDRGRIDFMNPSAQSMMGISSYKATGSDIFEMFELRANDVLLTDVHPVRECLRLREAGGLIMPRRDLALLNPMGSEFDVEITVAPMINGKLFMGALITIHDVTHAKEMQRKLTHAASHDPLTGLHNRSYFEVELARNLECAITDGLEHVLCFVDLDRFKIVNDSAGHGVGDILLKNVSQVISQCVRNSDIVARIGGDEFGILLLNCSIQKAQSVSNKIIETISGIRFSWDENIYDIGASIGVVAVNNTSKSTINVMSQADVACYAAKHAGRNRCSVYEDGQGEVQRHHQEILQAAGLRDAIETNRLVLHAQKIVPIQEQSDAELKLRYEVLVRMMDRQGGLIPPGAFIPAAERFGLMPMIDRWVIETALITYGPRIAEIPGMSIAINLSGNSLSDETFLEFLLGVIHTTGVKPSCIEFEVTETSVMNHMSVAAGILSKIRELGCTVALDDFGSGLSSYTYLRNFTVDYIKLDGSFIRNIHKSTLDWTIVDSMNQVAHRLNAETIAEFVESNEILEECKRIGIDYAQGYIIAEPTPLDDILTELENDIMVNASLQG